MVPLKPTFLRRKLPKCPLNAPTSKTQSIAFAAKS